MKDEKLIRIEYEEPPYRAIWTRTVPDRGQSDEEARQDFLSEFPDAVIRKITRFRSRAAGGA